MVAATRNICAVARELGLDRVVHLSSMAVLGNATGVLDETAPVDRASGNAYADAKIECERIVTAAAAHGLDCVILRPSCIYGPGSELWTVRIGRMLAARRLGDLGAAGDGKCNLVHVEDVAKAVLAALSADTRGLQVFNISNAETLTWNDYFVRLGRALGATPVRRLTGRAWKLETRLLAVPLKIAEMAAAAGRSAPRAAADHTVAGASRRPGHDARRLTRAQNPWLRAEAARARHRGKRSLARSPGLHPAS